MIRDRSIAPHFIDALFDGQDTSALFENQRTMYMYALSRTLGRAGMASNNEICLGMQRRRVAADIGPADATRRHYRAENMSLQILLNSTQAGPGRKVEQEQEEISPNNVESFFGA